MLHDEIAGGPGSLDITVVIPAYNREDTVARAVLSALGQDPRPPSEVLVVDDGSRDRTAEVASWAGARVITQANAGEGGARNSGLRAAGSRWVAFLDSDDQWLPNHLAVLIDHAAGHVLVGSNARAVPSGRLVGHPRATPFIVESNTMLWPESPLSPSASMVDRSAALGAGGFSSLRLGADREFWCRLLERGTGILVPDVTCIYHEHAGQISGDARAMRAARTLLLQSFRGRQWYDERISRKIDAVAAWDEFRYATRSREWRGARSALTRLASNPTSAPALAETLRYRAALRRR